MTSCKKLLFLEEKKRILSTFTRTLFFNTSTSYLTVDCQNTSRSDGKGVNKLLKAKGREGDENTTTRVQNRDLLRARRESPVATTTALFSSSVHKNSLSKRIRDFVSDWLKELPP